MGQYGVEIDTGTPPIRLAKAPLAVPPFASLPIQVLVAAFELSPDGIVVTDHAGLVIGANRRFAEMWGIPRPASFGRVGLPTLIAGRLVAPNELMKRLRQLERDEDAQDDLLLADGRIFAWHSVKLPSPVGDASGRLWYFRDVSRERHAAAQLDEAEAKFRSVVEQDIAGICIVAADGTLAYVNATFARFFGYTPAQLLGQPLLRIVPQNDRDAVTELLTAQLTGQPGVVRVISSVTTNHGTTVDVLIHATGVTYRGQRAAIAVVLDITELQQARRELEFANIIIEQSSIVLFRSLAQQNFRRTYISRNVARFGYTSEEVTYGHFQFPDFVHEADRPLVMDGIQKLVDQTVELFEQDYRLITRDGSVRWIHDRTVPIRDADGKVAEFQGMLVDITDRKRAEQSLERVNRALRTLSSGNEVVVRAQSEQQLLDEMCRSLVQIGQYMACWIGFATAHRNPPVEIVACCQRDGGTLAVETDAAAVLAALGSGRPAITQIGPLLPGGRACSVALPFTVGPAHRGVMVLHADTDDVFDADAVQLLSELANDLAYGIRSLRAHAARDIGERRLRDSMQATVQALVNTLELRDPYTAGHQRRVAALAVAIARALGLPPDETEGINMAAAVHDVGKVQVPAEILTKPGKLTKLEFMLVQTHAQAGYDILKGIDFPWPVATMVWQHHERMDGSGYPHGLRGDDILLGTRIVAVADVVETMMSHRPYRAALGLDAALAEVEDGQGRLYDPHVVAACVALFRRRGFQFV